MEDVITARRNALVKSWFRIPHGINSKRTNNLDRIGDRMAVFRLTGSNSGLSIDDAMLYCTFVLAYINTIERIQIDEHGQEEEEKETGVHVCSNGESMWELFVNISTLCVELVHCQDGSEHVIGYAQQLIMCLEIASSASVERWQIDKAGETTKRIQSQIEPTLNKIERWFLTEKIKRSTRSKDWYTALVCTLQLGHVSQDDEGVGSFKEEVALYYAKCLRQELRHGAALAVWNVIFSPSTRQRMKNKRRPVCTDEAHDEDHKASIILNAHVYHDIVPTPTLEQVVTDARAMVMSRERLNPSSSISGTAHSSFEKQVCVQHEQTVCESLGVGRISLGLANDDEMFRRPGRSHRQSPVYRRPPVSHDKRQHPNQHTPLMDVLSRDVASARDLAEETSSLMTV